MPGDETLQKVESESESESEDEEEIDHIPKVEIDPTKLTPLSPEVISKQATINLGTIGHVAHGKSTVVKAISGVMTVRFKNELVRNITIKLGYANAKIYKCENEACPRPGCYRSYRSDKEESPPCERPGCGHRMKLVRHVSFVDCPGHDILMATMLNGAAVMDAALLLIAGNETCPQPQTSEHLAAVEIMKLEHIIILQNKVDLIKETQALEHQKSISAFVKGTVAESSPIVPISAQLKYNIDAVNEYIVKRIPIPVRDFLSDPRLIVIRSFDVNKPGAEVEELKGGVAGGSILTGVLRIGQEVEIRPGIVTKDSAGRNKCQPIFSRIMSLHAENNLLSFAVPGGLIGVGTRIDPTLCRADRLVGQVLGKILQRNEGQGSAELRGWTRILLMPLTSNFTVHKTGSSLHIHSNSLERHLRSTSTSSDFSCLGEGTKVLDSSSSAAQPATMLPPDAFPATILPQSSLISDSTTERRRSPLWEHRQFEKTPASKRHHQNQENIVTESGKYRPPKKFGQFGIYCTRKNLMDNLNSFRRNERQTFAL